ncbi:MAG TPA: LLM class flavin-dependent oxidoreductase, partial [Miltoncostaeaceae bacterium]|nr:LLM class flavin-dependent oxidoreductase [Miltoncostaeaceae bacterium]
MRVGYLIDLHKGGYDQPMPSPQDAHDTMEAMIEEGILAEKYGFHSIQIPDRHGRTECYFPGPEQILTILARETDKVAIGSYTWLATLFHPMKGAEQFSVIDNLSQGRLYTTVSRGFHPGYWQQY